MEEIKYLPLGSVVLLNGGTKKVMIIARGLVVKGDGDRNYYFDYAGVRYPEGLTGNNIAYFNADQVANVVFQGYHSDEDEPLLQNLAKFLEANPTVPRYHLDMSAVQRDRPEK